MEHVYSYSNKCEQELNCNSHHIYALCFIRNLNESFTNNLPRPSAFVTFFTIFKSWLATGLSAAIKSGRSGFQTSRFIAEPFLP